MRRFHVAINKVFVDIKGAVITGAPKSGKTECLRILKESKYAKNIGIGAEISSLLIGELGILPSKDNQELEINYQVACRQIINTMEKAITFQEDRLGKKLILFDRGLADNCAWIGTSRYQEYFSAKPKDDVLSYDAIFFLELPPKTTFEKAPNNNPGRVEITYQECLEKEKRLKEIYSIHPNFFLINPFSTIKTKADMLLKNIIQFFPEVSK